MVISAGLHSVQGTGVSGLLVCMLLDIINVKNTVYRHVNGKIAQPKQQISELGF